VFCHRFFDHVLSRLGTPILIVGGKDDAGFVFESVGYRLYVYGAGNITAAPANKHTYSLHGLFLLIDCIF
jgi:hypothetical protein